MVARWRVWSFRRDLETASDQTPHVATSGASSGDSSATPTVRALIHLSSTLIMLVGAGELHYARVVHEAIGKLLISDDNTIAPNSPKYL